MNSGAPIYDDSPNSDEVLTPDDLLSFAWQICAGMVRFNRKRKKYGSKISNFKMWIYLADWIKYQTYLTYFVFAFMKYGYATEYVFTTSCNSSQHIENNIKNQILKRKSVKYVWGLFTVIVANRCKC